MFDKITRQFQPKPKVDPTLAGVMGTAVGVALGSAAAIYFSKSENRKKVTDTVKSLKNKANHLLAKREDAVADQKKSFQLE